ncbi:asparagine synthase [Haloferax larsenii JCM 13917]|nr:asparagine synthase-related protein [Haloferax larsenii]ELZ78279.1 asparagine synthase [Haloferax larsenii JCM 13917]
MAGLCGIVGPRDCPLGPLLTEHTRTGETPQSYDGGDVRVGVSTMTDANQPVSATPDVRLWVWGDVHGVQTADGYESRYAADDVPSTPAYCRGLYDRFGLDFLSRVNGTFAVALYDRQRERFHVATDRLGTHPIYLAETAGGAFVFGTDLQALAVYPAIDARFDADALSAFFATAAVPGTQTVFENVTELEPGTTLSYDLTAGETTREQYWTLSYRPVDRPFDEVADEFTETVRTVVNDRLRTDERAGVLLSGGSDSRLVLAAADDSSVVTYHMNDWMNREARAAERTAEAANVPFSLLQRDDRYPARILDDNAAVMNFYGDFNQGHVTGFLDDIHDEVDLLVTGLYSDWLFKGLSIRRWTIPLGPLGTFQLPWEDAPADADEYVQRCSTELPPYLSASASKSLDGILADGVEAGRDGLEYHGVTYPSLRELVSYGECYPMSNDADLFYYGLTQTKRHWTPFLDNRLVDLALTVPVKHLIGPNLVNAAVARLDADLAAIPHASTGVPLSRRYPLDFLQTKVNAFDHLFVRPEHGEKSYHVSGPWMEDGEYIRDTSFVLDTLVESRAVIDALPFLDWDGVVRTYHAHLAGADYSRQLYTLLSFVRMPAVRHLAGVETVVDEVETVTEVGAVGEAGIVDEADMSASQFQSTPAGTNGELYEHGTDGTHSIARSDGGDDR